MGGLKAAFEMMLSCTFAGNIRITCMEPVYETQDGEIVIYVECIWEDPEDYWRAGPAVAVIFSQSCKILQNVIFKKFKTIEFTLFLDSLVLEHCDAYEPVDGCTFGLYDRPVILAVPRGEREGGRSGP